MKEEIIKFCGSMDCFGLILPSGWFGRPYDNFHQLTWIEERKSKLIVEIDNQLYLIFTKPIQLEVINNNLVITGFEQLVFDYQGYGNMKPHCELFNYGEVEFICYLPKKTT